MKIKRPNPMPRPVVRKQPPKLKIMASIARSRSPRTQDDDEDYYDSPEPNMKLSHAFVVVLVLHVIAVGGVFAFNTIKSNQRPNIAASVAAESPETVQDTKPTEPLSAPPSGMVAPPSPSVASAAEPLGATAPAAPAAATPANGTTHEVKAGETLTRIASQYGISAAVLQEANAIEDPTKIRIGTLLVIPVKGQAAAAAQAVVQTPPAPAVQKVAAPAATPKPVAAAPVAASSGIKDSGKVYEVANGDNPVSIARKLNVSYNDLLALNNIDDPRRLQIGQKLKVPTAN